MTSSHNHPHTQSVRVLRWAMGIVLLLSGGFLPLRSDSPDAKQNLPLAERARQLHSTLSRISVLGNDRLGYLELASKHLNAKYELGELPRPLIAQHTESRAKEIDAFSLLSGGLAIRESLQLDRIPLFKADDDTIALASLKGPEIKAHPFHEMMRGRTSSAPDIAVLVPHDFYYLHVQDASRSLELLDRLNESLGQLMGHFFPASVDFQTTEKLMTQLAIRIDPSNRKYYSHIIEQMAIVGSDPFFMNGSDVTFIYRLKQKAVFQKTLNDYREHYKLTLGAVASEIEMDGLKVQSLQTPDRRVHSFAVWLSDDTVIVSNSPGALRAVIAVHQKRRPSMAEQDEYRYMRSIYPFDPGKGSGEAAFLYLSDPFIRRLVGPEVRIKEARRVMELARLAALERYAILYFQLHGKRAHSLADLREEFTEEELAPFEGLELSSSSLSATSKKYGSIGRMLPNIDTSLTAISQPEAEGYARFLANYNQYWRTYFDPIGIRLTGDKRIKIETCILPILDNSFYNGLIEISGGSSARLASGKTALNGEVLSTSFTVNREQLAKALSKGMQEHLDHEGIRLEDILGEEIQIHVLDSRPMVDFDAGALMRETLRRGSPGDKALVGVLAWSLFHPIRVAVPLKKAEDGDKLLNVIDAMVRSELKSSSSWLHLDLYEQVVDGKKFHVYLISIEDVLKFRLYYAVHNGTLHLTSTQEHMMQILQGGLDRGLVERFLDFFRKTEEPIKANVVGMFRPERLVAERDMFLAGAAESAKAEAFRNLSTFALFQQLFGERMDEASLESFGFRLDPPGALSIDANGNPVSNIFGSVTRPIINMDRASSLKRPLQTEQIRLSLEFTKEGLKSTIEVDP